MMVPPPRDIPQAGGRGCGGVSMLAREVG